MGKRAEAPPFACHATVRLLIIPIVYFSTGHGKENRAVMTSKFLLRLLVKFALGICLLVSLTLAILWVRSYYVQYDLNFVDVNRTTLTMRVVSLGFSLGRVGYGDESTIFDEMDGLDWGLELEAMDAQPLGFSCAKKRPMHYSLEPWYDPWINVVLGWTYSDLPVSRLHRDTGAVDLLGSCSKKGNTIVFPIWEPLLLFLLPPLIAGALYVRRRWRPNRPWNGVRCRKCGYDLRASKGRCPECGTPL
jgi:hypothetical protein